MAGFLNRGTGLSSLGEPKMKLTDSEVLLLSQLLFHIRATPNQSWAFDESFEKLYEKLCLHFVPSINEDEQDLSYHGEQHCAWHEAENQHFEYHCDENESHEEEEKNDDTAKVSKENLFKLDPIRVDYNGKRSLSFEKGIHHTAVDITLDNGDEILCDVTEIERNGYTLEVNCAEGLVVFDVNKFPKAWTSLLAVKTLYKVV